MVWYLPIGVYEGIKMTSEITDSTVDISGDGEIPHAVLRVGAGSMPLPDDAGPILEILATAPGEIQLLEWLDGSANPADNKKLLNELNENGLLLTFEDGPLSDDELHEILIALAQGATESAHQPAPYGVPGHGVVIESGTFREVVDPASLSMVRNLSGSPTSLANALRSLEASLPNDRRQFAQQVLQVDLQALVRSRAVDVFLAE